MPRSPHGPEDHRHRRGIALVFLACSACAVRQPVSTWRLMQRDTGRVLIPPDVAGPDLAQRTITVDLGAGHRACPSTAEAIAIQIRGKHARLTVTRDTLAKQPPGWLGAWAVQLEEQRCLPPGNAVKLAARIADSIPLDPAAALRLLYPNGLQTGVVDLGAESRISVVTPLLREEGKGIMAEGPSTVTGSGNSLTVTGKSTDNLLGYETTIYALQPRPGQAGFAIVPLYTDRNVQGATERRPGPVTNYFRFPAGAAWYGLFYKADPNDFTALAVAARTPAELQRSIQTLRASGASASCQMLRDAMCIAIPREAGVNPLVHVTVNGAEVLVPRGATVFNAILTSGERQPNRVLPNLTVSKPWNGRPIPVTFDRADGAILQLGLRGGEAIAWR